MYFVGTAITMNIPAIKRNLFFKIAVQLLRIAVHKKSICLELNVNSR